MVPLSCTISPRASRILCCNAVTAIKDTESSVKLGVDLEEGKIDVEGTWTQVNEFMKKPVPTALSLYIIEVR